LLKIEEKFGKTGLGRQMVEVAQSSEMVRNFNNFKVFVTFAIKKLEVMLILVEKL
jgi:hypothetical protein